MWLPRASFHLSSIICELIGYIDILIAKELTCTLFELIPSVDEINEINPKAHQRYPITWIHNKWLKVH